MIQIVRFDSKGRPKPTSEMLKDAARFNASGVSLALPCIESEAGGWCGRCANFDLDGNFLGYSLWPVEKPFEVQLREQAGKAS
jgi:hypothetical protein